MGKGIYGIKINNELVYVGKTNRDFNERWKEHIYLIEHPQEKNSQQDYLYKAIREAAKKGDEIKFCVLVPASNATDEQLKSMEYALIVSKTPKFNYQGVKVPYPGINGYNLDKPFEYYRLDKKIETWKRDLEKCDEIINMFEDKEDLVNEIKKEKAILEEKLLVLQE